jgi:hypothetical protein
VKILRILIFQLRLFLLLSATATSLIGSKIALRIKLFWIVGNHMFVEAGGCRKQPWIHGREMEDNVKN